MLDPKDCAAELIQRFEIKGPSVPVFEIAQKLGAKVIKKSDFGTELSGMIFREGDNIVIGVNDTDILARQRFTVAHEIGHLVMHSEIINKVHIDKNFDQNLKRDGRSKLGQDRMEIQANRFAAELLMPTQFLKKEFKTGYIDFESGLEKLAEKYEVSVQAMSIKMMDVFPGIYKDKI